MGLPPTTAALQECNSSPCHVQSSEFLATDSSVLFHPASSSVLLRPQPQRNFKTMSFGSYKYAPQERATMVVTTLASHHSCQAGVGASTVWMSDNDNLMEAKSSWMAISPRLPIWVVGKLTCHEYWSGQSEVCPLAPTSSIWHCGLHHYYIPALLPLFYAPTPVLHHQHQARILDDLTSGQPAKMEAMAY